MKQAKPGHNLNNLDRGLQDEASYQISKSWASYCHTYFLKCFVILVCKTSDPRAIIWTGLVRTITTAISEIGTRKSCLRKTALFRTEHLFGIWSCIRIKSEVPPNIFFLLTVPLLQICFCLYVGYCKYDACFSVFLLFFFFLFFVIVEFLGYLH